ncbi:MAG TPA: hypothetical protein VF188_02470 [Longimicrobiales bacterium]
MPPPYTTEEVAAAIREAAHHRALALERLEVQADTVARVWRLRATTRAGEVLTATLPFSLPRGILTPAELAERFLGGAWLFP